MSELVTKEHHQLATVPASWGSEGSHAEDNLIPRIQLLQAMSEQCKTGTNRPGELVNSLSGEILAKPNEGVEVIPISMYREWQIMKKISETQFEFLRNEPITDLNTNWAKDDMENGYPIRRNRTLNFFVLLPTALNKMPFLVSFRKTSLQAGKKLATHFSLCRYEGKPPASTVFSLSAKYKTWKSNSFHVFEVAQKRDTQLTEMEKAYQWYQLINQKSVVVAEEAEAVAAVDRSEEV